MLDAKMDQQRADWSLLCDGPINLYRRKSLFRDATEALRALDYQVVHIVIKQRQQFETALSKNLRWMDQFGYEPWDGNFNALVDGLRYPHEYGLKPDLALCFEDFHQLSGTDASYAAAVLDVIAGQSRYHLLQGRRTVALIQTNDADYRCDGLGATSARWNTQEWFIKDRG